MTNITSSFGQSSNSSPTFGQTGNAHTSAFGFQMKAPLYGDAPASGTNTTPFGAFGQSSNSSSIFGQTSNANTSAFGFEKKRPLFGVASTSGTNATLFGAFGHPAPIFGQTGNANTSASGTNTKSICGGQNTIPPFGTTGFNQSKGSRQVAYNATPTTDDIYGSCHLQSISAMPVHSGKSHEELRFEDYNAGDRGGIANGFSSISTMANPFVTQISSSLNPPETTPYPSVVSPQNTFTSFPSQTTSFSFPSQTTSSPQNTFTSFPSQITSTSFPCQTTSYSQSTFSSLPLQTTSSPQTTFTSFPSQITSISFPSQTTSSPHVTFTSVPSQITSISFPLQTTSSPHSTFTSIPSQITSILFPCQTTFTSCPSQTTSILFPSQTIYFPSQAAFSLQTTSTSVPSQETSNTFPPQTTSISFPSQTISFPSQTTFPPQTTANLFPTQTASISPSSQTSSGWFPPQTCSAFSPHTSFGPLQTSVNPFVPIPSYPLQTQTPYNEFPNQNSTCSLSPKRPATTFAPKNSSFTFPTLYGSIAPKTSSTLLPPTISPSVALPVLNNFKTCTHCSTSSSPSPEFNKFPNVDEFNSTHYVSTSNPSISARDPFLSHPSHSTPTVQTTNLQSSEEVISRSFSSQGLALQSSVVDQPVVSSIPFGELPAMTHLTINQPGSTISMPVPGSVRESTPVSIENPRSRVVLSAELWPRKSETEEVATETNTSLDRDEYGLSSQNNTKKAPVIDINLTMSALDPRETKSYREHTDDIKALLPQLSLPDYFTEPTIKQLAEKETAEPGFCIRVKDFEVGRYGYGSIKFLGETDVRRLCIDSLIEFDNRKIVVYKNENKKSYIGKGLNKRAEITLINIQCIDKETGEKYVEGPKVEKYKEMLIKKGEEQGAEFISYDPVKGEWKFRVWHF